MDRKIITKDGLKTLSRVFVSCRPIMGDILTPNQLYLIEHARIGKDVSFDLFVSKLPLPDDTYIKILDFAQSIGENKINEDVVCRFFGGEPHFQKILAQLEDNRIKKDFALRIFFAHILIPIKLIEVKGCYVGIYKNKNVEVVVSNLVLLDNNIKVKAGDIVLVHYASIITTSPAQDIVSHLLDVQAQNTEFIKACKQVVCIDYNKFWNLKKWTEDIAQERGII